MKPNTLVRSISLAIGLLGIAASSFADSITFSNSVGTQPTNVGVITLTDVNATTVKVLVDLLPGYGFINTGGANAPHTPFAFTLGGTEAGVSISSFVQPLNGVALNGTFSLNLAGGANSPYGNGATSYGVAIDYSGPTGGGLTKGYFGDLEFNLTRTSGLTVNDFIANPLGYYFSADLAGPTGNTGGQAWNTKDTPPPPPVPDSGTTVVLLGVGLIAISLIRRKIA